MSKYKSLDAIYVGDEYVTDEETALAEKSVLLIKSYKIIKNVQCYIIIMKTIDNKTIGPCMMSYDTFNHLFAKGYVADVVYEIWQIGQRIPFRIFAENLINKMLKRIKHHGKCIKIETDIDVLVLSTTHKHERMKLT